jgi:hypothetical protein
MTWDPRPSTFERARRQGTYRRLARILRRRHDDGLLLLDDVQRRLRLFDQHYVGIRSIPVKDIVGTTDQSALFDKNFLPLRPEMRKRWERIERAFPGGTFPPIIVYKVDDSYFVVDGHHRVAIAKQRRAEFIDAEVTELRTRYKLPPGADYGKLIALEQERIFMEDSGLDRARPEARIRFSRPQGYVELLEIVQLHGFHMMRERQAVLPMEEIAGHWYDHVYLPTMDAIRRERLGDDFPEASDGDLFLWVSQHRRAMLPERGGMTLPETVSALRAERSHGARRRRGARVRA